MYFTSAKAFAALLSASLGANALSYAFQQPRDDWTSISIRATDVLKDLGPQLSSNATIYLPGDSQFVNSTTRFSTFRAPNFTVFVDPGVEADVSTIVKYANKVNLPFLAVSTSHGHTETLGRLQHGIEIHVGNLYRFEISEDKKTVWTQGGAWTDSITPGLWDAGYVTTTGSCGCVSLLGPGLGGGFGPYLGQYGLVSDSIVSLNMVLSNGSEVTVSKDEHPDLYWAVRGAGHNFGIVTSLIKEIHPRKIDTWFWAENYYSQDKLEDLTSAINTVNDLGEQDPRLTILVDYRWTPAFDPESPTIYLAFIFSGSQTDASPLYAPFSAIGTLNHTGGNVPYPGLREKIGLDSTSPTCVGGLSSVHHPLGLLKYNVTTQRQVLDHFKEYTVQHPEYNNTVVMTETYGVAAMKAVPAKSSAYAHWEDNILVTLNVLYPRNVTLDEGAIEFSSKMKDIWQAGQAGRKPNAYVNYAFGDEGMKQWYGYEEWRLERLRATKREYDPKGRFNYYNPITY